MEYMQNKCSWGFRSFVRRKQVDSVHMKREGRDQLARKLSLMDLIAIRVGATIGAGVYVLVGTVAREHAGPALTISFLIAGIAAALSAFCYAELASRCPSAGSAYHYSYICLGEGVAWFVGWALVLEYTIGASAVARGITPNLAFFFGGLDKLPAILARHTMPVIGVVVDPSAAVLVLIVTFLLCTGIKESSLVQMIVTSVNVSVMLFILIVGGYMGFKTGWVGYELPSGYFPFGINGMLSGSAVVFFSYIGFDSVTSTAEEVKNPQRDLPLGIALALLICCILYMLVSVVVTGLVPYYSLDPDTPISSVFSGYGVQWAVYVITTGAVTALFSSLLGSILSQPRILMAMARDGLLPSSFSDINENTQVPVKSTVTTGTIAAVLAFFMDVSQLAGMVSVGTLFAFTTAAVSVLILRYVPPDEVPLSPSLQESIKSVSLRFSYNTQECDRKNLKDSAGSSKNESHNIHGIRDELLGCPPIEKCIAQENLDEQTRRNIAAWTITCLCIGVFILAFTASAKGLSSTLRLTLCGLCGIFLLFCLIVLSYIGQDAARHNFGHGGGFTCPFVPFLPAACILINTYLLIDLGAATWIRVSIWFAIGGSIYLFYGRMHSALLNAIYVPLAYADEIRCSSSQHHLA
ncbi:cationic amino acid transporter 4, vacuolar-like [Argentina anserina]|uniref:cationic amino acid transporter 4, vacuolar-like n=1 Tax=Argentina anserina TaxID=57926 RepID=UPI0021761EF2|nr:cationic amino acid transporter 4, vacuolar-like [Potentilla anserina]